MSQVTDVVRREIELYREASEVWQRDHQQAMACYNFEDLLKKGTAAFEMANRVDESFRRAVFRGEDPFDAQLNSQIAALFDAWAATGREVLKTLEAFERAGFKVDHSDDFRRCCREAEAMIANPADFFTGDAIAQLRDEALEAHARGETSEFPS